MTLIQLIVRRVLLSIVTLLLVTAIIFAAVEILPGDVASRVLGRDATPEALAALRSAMHLDQPPLTRYLTWLGGILQGDFGRALTSSRPVSEILGPRILNTLILSAVAFLLHLPIMLVPAIIQALNRDRWIDQAISIGTVVVVSLPEFVLATLILLAFVVGIPVLPATSVVSAGSSLTEWVRALALPTGTIAIVMAVYSIRMLRDSLIEILDAEYVRMAELKGMPRYKALLRHALPNAMGPTLNVTALNLAYLIGGVVIVERVFVYPGFGNLMVDALMLRDLPVIEACVLCAATVYIAGNLLADLAAVLLNPRLRGV